MSQTAEQRGRDVTIYAKDNLEKSVDDWFNIIQEISEELTSAGIQPGYEAVNKDNYQTQIHPIVGSNYACYGYEAGETTEGFYDVCSGYSVTVEDPQSEPTV